MIFIKLTVRRFVFLSAIGGFRDTYLGRQVVSRPRGPRTEMGSAGGLGALRAPLAESGLVASVVCYYEGYCGYGL